MNALKRLDFYRKLSTDYTSQTFSGGILSLTFVGFMVVLVISEVKVIVFTDIEK
jgi:hypothetical protein